MSDRIDAEIVEKLAEKMHIWYLEATRMLHPESYNPKAQKAYSELTEKQKNIDRYIAGHVIGMMESIETITKGLEEIEKETMIKIDKLFSDLKGEKP